MALRTSCVAALIVSNEFARRSIALACRMKKRTSVGWNQIIDKESCSNRNKIRLTLKDLYIHIKFGKTVQYTLSYFASTAFSEKQGLEFSKLLVSCNYTTSQLTKYVNKRIGTCTLM